MTWHDARQHAALAGAGVVVHLLACRVSILSTRSHEPDIPLEHTIEHQLNLSSQIHRESDNPSEHTAEK